MTLHRCKCSRYTKQTGAFGAPPAKWCCSSCRHGAPHTSMCDMRQMRCAALLSPYSHAATTLTPAQRQALREYLDRR